LQSGPTGSYFDHFTLNLRRFSFPSLGRQAIGGVFMRRHSVSFLLHQSWRVGMRNDIGKLPTKIGTSNMFVSAAPGPAEMLREVLQYNFGRFRNGAKLLAKAANVSPRTAQSWLYGLASPSFGSMVELMASSEELAAAVNKIVKDHQCSGLASASLSDGTESVGACGKSGSLS
jgi:hypothetical protein